ncbi:MAG TPA: hypothetical protein V6D22_20165 [Candidatus Obscuribacterales bacterium]
MQSESEYEARSDAHKAHTTENTFLMPILMAFVCVVGLFFAWEAYLELQYGLKCATFRPVTAIVEHSRTGYSRSRRRSSTYIDLTFSYQGFDGSRQLHSLAVDPSWAGSDWGTPWANDADHFRGRTLTIHVNSLDSSEWSKIHGPENSSYVKLAFGILVAIAGGVMFYPMLFKLFASDGDCSYIPPDDPRALIKDQRFRY